MASRASFKAWGMIGEAIASSRRRQTKPLMRPHIGLIILGLGSSRKSAPLIPKLRETMLREKVKSKVSARLIAAIPNEGDQSRPLTIEHTNVTAREKRTAKEYLALTRLRAVMGDE